MNTKALTLAHLGELRLIEEIILPLARKCDVRTVAGDDCAYLPTNGMTLAVTADVGPKPLLLSLPGYENDLEAAGWLAVVATASDVATAGARPFFLTNCIDAPPDLPVADFETYLRGYFNACAEFGFFNGGGDVRHGPVLSIRVFGAGKCEHPYKIGRRGARLGDKLVLIGPPGVFMATYLLAAKGHRGAVSDGRLTPEAASILRYPRPQLREIAELAKHGVFSAASDTSDGLIGAIDNLSRGSNCSFQLVLNDELLPESVSTAASEQEINPWNIFVAWGDWSVVATVPDEKFTLFTSLCADHRISWMPLGMASGKEKKITARLNEGPEQDVTVLRNENFVSRGFNAGLKGHLDYMLTTPLFNEIKTPL
jgi:thiamine-monophosphate kinase